MHFLLLLLAFACSTVSAAIKINGTDINDVAKPGESITITAKDADNITLQFEDNNLITGTFKFNNFEEIQKMFAERLSKKDELGGFRSKSLNMSSGNGNFDAQLFSAEQINLSARENMHMANSILESANPIHVTAKNFYFESCLINSSHALCLHASSEDTLFQGIQFNFSEGAELRFIEGAIDFEKGSLSELFVVHGTNQVTITFHPSAFETQEVAEQE